MKALATIALVLAAALSSAQSVTISPVYKEGDKIVHSLTLNLDISGLAQGVLKADLTSLVGKVTAETTEVKSTFDNLSVLVNDSDAGTTAVEMVRVLNRDGSLKDVTGGLQGGDNYRTSLLTTFFAPEAAVNAGDTYERKFPENKSAGIGALTAKGKYIGEAEVAGQKGYKFTLTLKEAGEDAFDAEVTYVVQADGRILSIDGKFKNMPIPAAGAVATGTIKAEIKPSV
ncbi:MAG: hypothetical protein SFX74_09260 [Fimbriimonadaceae bacterium]|nr:hypothetical protein [Fimbriimonadaceae bacterium]